MQLLTFKVDEKIVLTECFDFTVYVRHSFHDCREGILHFYDEAVKSIGSEARWYFTESMTFPKKLDGKALEMVPFWFAPGARTRSDYHMTIRAGKSARDIQPRRFQLVASETPRGKPPLDDSKAETGVLRLALPSDEAAQHPDRLVSMFRDLVNRLPFVSGHAGFGLVWEELDEDADVERKIAAWARRYEGLDIYPFLDVGAFVRTGIKCVNWLTLINGALVSELGGRASLQKKLGRDIVLHDVGEGLIIQAGPAPRLGDKNKDETLPEYHKVGRVLRPVRNEPATDELYAFIGGSEDATIEWLARFDE